MAHIKCAYSLVCKKKGHHSANMSQTVKKSRAPNKIRRVKAAEQDNDYRRKLIEVGARLFVQKGMAEVSVEDLIKEAGVSRATYYGLYANKDELAADIVIPVFKDGSDWMAQLLNHKPAKIADGLADVYLALWDKHKDAVIFSGAFGKSVFPYMAEAHNQFSQILLNVLQVLCDNNLLRNDDVKLTYMVLAKTGMPLLRVYADHPELKTHYRASIKALIFRD